MKILLIKERLPVYKFKYKLISYKSEDKDNFLKKLHINIRKVRHLNNFVSGESHFENVEILYFVHNIKTFKFLFNSDSLILNVWIDQNCFIKRITSATSALAPQLLTKIN